GLVTTEKVGRVRTCKLGSGRLEEETAWLEKYRQVWDARFDELDKVVEELKRRENADGRKKREGGHTDEEPHDGGTEIRAGDRRHADFQRSGAHRVRGVDQARAVQAVVGAEVDGHVPAFLRDGCSCRGQVPFGVRPRCLKA